MSGARAGLVCAAILVALGAGVLIGGRGGDVLPEPLREVFIAEPSSATDDAAEIIEENYFRAVDESQIEDASLNGIVEGLRRRYDDRFSHYFNPDALERFNQSIQGRFTGVGLSVSEVDRGLLIGEVFDGTPAKRAGIVPGEIVVSVNGKSIAGQDSDLVTARIKGPEGTRVRIGVLDRDSGRTRQVRLTRADIDLPVVTDRIRRTPDGREVGYIRMASFTEGVHALLREAIDRVREKGAEGIVLDLRANGGGLLQEAILTSSIFVPEGETIVSTKSRTQGDSTYPAVGGDIGSFPFVVLVDRSTASAAEILAAAMAIDADATVVGTRTFGKGVFQQVISLPNGGALDLTIGEFFTADGTNLAGKGFPPDVKSRDDPDTPRDEALREALRVLEAKLPAPGDS